MLKIVQSQIHSMVLYPNVKPPNLHILLLLFVWRLHSHSSGFHCQLCVDLQDPSWISSESSLLEDDIVEEVTLLWKLHNFHLIKSSSMDLLFQFSWPLCYEWLCKSLLREHLQGSQLLHSVWNCVVLFVINSKQWITRVCHLDFLLKTHIRGIQSDKLQEKNIPNHKNFAQ